MADGFAVLRWTFSVCFLFALRRKVVLAQLCKSCSFFSPAIFPLEGPGRFFSRARWQLQPSHLRAGRQPAPGPVPPPCWELRPPGMPLRLPGSDSTHGSGFCGDPLGFLAGREPPEPQALLLLHTAPGKPTCAALRARKEHMQILQMSKYLNFKTNEG